MIAFLDMLGSILIGVVIGVAIVCLIVGIVIFVDALLGP